MDVPEASKHGKKSTGQKLEDQKKVGKTFLFCFFFSFLLRNASLSSSPAVCVCACCFFRNDQLWLLLFSSRVDVEAEG